MSPEAVKNGEGGQGGGEPNVTELQAQVSKLEGQMGEVEKARTVLADKVGDYEKTFMSKEWLDFMDSQKGGEGEEGEEGKETPTSEGKVDLNNLNPSQLAEHLSKQFGVALEKIQSDHDSEIKDMQTVFVQQLARVNLEFTKVNHSNPATEPGGKSLTDKLGPLDGKTDEQKSYHGKFMNVAKENPTWDGEKVYKYVEMEIAADAHAVKQAEGVQKEKERLALTEHASDASPSTVDGKQLTEEQAVDEAYKATMATSGVKTE